MELQPVIIFFGVVVGTVIALIGMFFWAGMWATLAAFGFIMVHVSITYFVVFTTALVVVTSAKS